jgi:uncharacterized protein YciI
MHFIYVLELVEQYRTLGNWDEETHKVLDMHWEYLLGLHQKGIMLVVGRTNYDVDNENTFGIAVFKAADLAAATEIMQNDPCVKYNVMRAKVHPFNLALI